MAWQAPNLDKEKHCFLGSEGGVSEGKYAGLNVNTRSLDNEELLAKNLTIAAAKLKLKKENLLLLNQGVSSTAVYVREASQDKIEADGLVTDCPDIALCIRTADCAPVLLEDRVNGIVGAAHAGWRGAIKGIVENVVNLMLEKGADLNNIAAAVGPCIGQKSYEVDEGFYQQFVEQDKAYDRYFMTGAREKFYLFDLETFCVDKLKVCGIKNIAFSAKDTYALEDEYFSFRRFTHLGLVGIPKDFPTELSAIRL